MLDFGEETTSRTPVIKPLVPHKLKPRDSLAAAQLKDSKTRDGDTAEVVDKPKKTKEKKKDKKRKERLAKGEEEADGAQEKSEREIRLKEKRKQKRDR